MAHFTLLGHKDVHSEVGEIIGPHHLIGTLHCSTSDSMEGRQSAFQKSRPVNF